MGTIYSGRGSLAFALCLLHTNISHAIDFDRELAKQSRTVHVAYRPPPKSLANFMAQYRVCQQWRGIKRTLCNQDEAKRRYEAYREDWIARHTVRSLATVGEFTVVVEKRKP